MRLLSVSGRLTAADDKSNIMHSFSVPSGLERLVVKYEYGPKEIEDRALALEAVKRGAEKYGLEVESYEELLPVKNLVTLSFDENGRYRGACHRQPSRQTVIIAAEDSTPGVLNGEIGAGEWRIVLNAHYIGCELCYKLEVEGEEK